MLTKGLDKYLSLDTSRFFTPGHKGQINRELLRYDLTELPMTDNLYSPKEFLRASQKKASDYYGSSQTYFSAGGNTLCINAMLRLAFSGKKMLFHRYSHVSAVNAIILLGIEPVWLCERTISSESVKKAISSDDVCALYITSPDYYGKLQDIKGISEVCAQFGVPLLVDNAHGSHLKPFKLHPLDFNVSMCADSAHKTLPVLTGGAFLHINSDAYRENVLEAMRLFGSTSPNFATLASLDCAVDWLMSDGENKLIETAKTVNSLRKAAETKGIRVIKDNADPLKLTLLINGNKAYDHFLRHKVEPELSDEAHTVFMCSPFNTERDFERLYTAIESLNPEEPFNIAKTSAIPDIAMLPREAAFCKSHTVDIVKAKNLIAAESPYVCPPGIPLVAAGERITDEIIENAVKNKIRKIKTIIRKADNYEACSGNRKQ